VDSGDAVGDYSLSDDPGVLTECETSEPSLAKVMVGLEYEARWRVSILRGMIPVDAEKLIITFTSGKRISVIALDGPPVPGNPKRKYFGFVWPFVDHLVKVVATGRAGVIAEQQYG
jgi:hypothetical protein